MEGEACGRNLDPPVLRRIGIGGVLRLGLAVAGRDDGFVGQPEFFDQHVLHRRGAALRQALVEFVAAAGIGVAGDDEPRALALGLAELGAERREPRRCRAVERRGAERETQLDVDPLGRRDAASVFRIELRTAGELLRPERFDGLLAGRLLRLGLRVLPAHRWLPSARWREARRRLLAPARISRRGGPSVRHRRARPGDPDIGARPCHMIGMAGSSPAMTALCKHDRAAASIRSLSTKHAVIPARRLA